MSGFQLGELILTSKPYVYVLSNECRRVRCDCCFKEEDALKRCGQCGFTCYCNAICQKKAWPLHKLECKFIKRAKPREPTATMRLIALLMLKTKADGGEEPVENVYGRQVSFTTLMSHAKEVQQNMRALQQIVALTGTLKDYIGFSIADQPILIDVFGKMCTNSFNITDDELESIGVGIYLGASVFDHSCEPDAITVFDGINLSVRAVKNIPHRDISKIYIPYVDLFQLTKDRQDALREQYYFCCQCPRCTSPEYEELSKKLLVSDAESVKKANEFHSKLGWLDSIFKSKNLNESEGPTLFKTLSKLVKDQEKILAETNFVRVKTLYVAFSTAVWCDKFAEAIPLGLQLVKFLKFYDGPYHPSIGNILFAVAKLQYVLQMPSAAETLKQARENMKVTHGEEHSLYKFLLQQVFKFETLSLESLSLH